MYIWKTGANTKNLYMWYLSAACLRVSSIIYSTRSWKPYYLHTSESIRRDQCNNMCKERSSQLVLLQIKNWKDFRDTSGRYLKGQRPHGNDKLSWKTSWGSVVLYECYRRVSVRPRSKRQIWWVSTHDTWRRAKGGWERVGGRVFLGALASEADGLRSWIWSPTVGLEESIRSDMARWD